MISDSNYILDETAPRILKTYCHKNQYNIAIETFLE